MNTFISILRRCLIAFFVGWTVSDVRYYTNFVLNKPDSSLQTRDIGALTAGSGIVTLIFILLSLGLGLLFLIAPVRRWWLWVSDRAIIPIIVGSGVLLYLGNMDIVTWSILNLCMIFPIVNWPGKPAEERGDHPPR